MTRRRFGCWANRRMRRGLSGLLPNAGRCEVLAGRGTATLEDHSLAVSIPEPLDYLWVRVERGG